MRRALVFVLCVSCLPALGSVASDRAAVLATVDRLSQAGIAHDVATLSQLYADDYFHTNPDGSLMDRATVLESYSTPTPFTFFASERDEEHVLIEGDCAIVSLRTTLRGKRGDDPFSSRYRVTYVLRKRHGRWKFVNSHSSLLGIFPGEAEKKR